MGNVCMNDWSQMKDRLTSLVSAQLSGNIDSVCTKELGEVVDMIKDFAEAEKYCREAEYYKAVNEAMLEKPEEDERYGYTRRTGRHIPHSNTTPFKPYIDQEPYIDGYLNDPDFAREMRMGYDGNMGNTSNRMSYGDNRYGKSYNDYRISRRHYTESKSENDKDEMEMHAREHVNDTMETIREIYKSADPELRKRIKANLTTLVNEMVV